MILLYDNIWHIMFELVFQAVFAYVNKTIKKMVRIYFYSNYSKITGKIQIQANLIFHNSHENLKAIAN